jgi:osmotically inducible lipoprotein OsmB
MLNCQVFSFRLIRSVGTLIFYKGDFMKTFKFNRNRYFLAAAIFSLGACASMSEQEKGTAIGAGVGAVGGAVLGGGTLGTLGGAAVGGVVGHEVTKPKK